MQAHTPVLLEEVLAGLNLKPEGRYCDATFGRGGHTAAILAQLGAGGSCDRDRSRSGSDPRGGRAVRTRTASHCDQGVVRATQRVRPGGRVERGVATACCSISVFLRHNSMQPVAASASCRMDRSTCGWTTSPDRRAAQWLARATEREIADTLFALGEERFARRIARAIVQTRGERPLTRTAELAALVASAVPTREPGKHPATRTFQALRMRVNDELDALERRAAASARAARRGRTSVRDQLPFARGPCSQALHAA